MHGLDERLWIMGEGRQFLFRAEDQQVILLRVASLVMGQPPIIWRYQVSWCCFAQARVTVPYSMARIVPLVQIAA